MTALLNTGFVKIEAAHHTMFWLVAGGRRRAIRTRLSHGQRKVDDWLLSEMAKQVRLSKQELLSLIDCEMTGEEYLRLMIDRGYFGS
ncbi:MAG: hypothetical protein AAB225_14940 [Acidobacteriota bacterium]